jgi:hypothetical protein
MISVVDPDSDRVVSTSYCRIGIGIQGMPIRIMAVVSVMIALCDGFSIFDVVDDDCGCGWNDAVDSLMIAVVMMAPRQCRL